MCGIIAILLGDSSKRVNELIYDGLTVLQHRGQGIIFTFSQSYAYFH